MNTIRKMKKLLLFILAMAMTVGVSGMPMNSVKAADKTVYSYIADFPTKQNENEWFINCGASSASYSGGSWTNGDTHQKPAVYTKNRLTTCNTGGVSYIQFKAPRSGSVQIVFQAAVSGKNDGGLFGILLCDPKRGNVAEPDKTSAEPIFPYGMTGWFEMDRYELVDGETLSVDEYVDVDEGDFIQFCLCGKNDQWNLDLITFEVRYEDGGASSGTQGSTGGAGTGTSSGTQNADGTMEAADELAEDEAIFAETADVRVFGEKDAFAENTVVAVENVIDAEKTTAISEKLKEKVSRFIAYEIKATNNEEAVEPSKTVKATFKIPEGFDMDKVELFYVNADGEVEKIEATVDEEAKTITAELTQVGTYVVGEKAEIQETAIDNKEKVKETEEEQFVMDYTPFYLMGAGLGVLLLAIIVVFIVCHKKGLI